MLPIRLIPRQRDLHFKPPIRLHLNPLRQNLRTTKLINRNRHLLRGPKPIPHHQNLTPREILSTRRCNIVGIRKPDSRPTFATTHHDLSAYRLALDGDAEFMRGGGGDETELDLEGAVYKVDLWDCDEGCGVEGYVHGLVAREVEVCAEEVEGLVHFGLWGSNFGDYNSFVERYDLRVESANFVQGGMYPCMNHGQETRDDKEH